MLSQNIVRESYKKVLCSIAEDGEATQYELRSATGLNYASVHAAIEQFLAWQLIEETRREAGPGPTPKRFFGLTLKGLAFAFRWNEKNLSKHMDKVAEKWGSIFPLALGKWKYFVVAGLEKEFMNAFVFVVKWFLEWGYDTENFATEQFWYFIFQMTAGAAKVKWLKALRGDSELRQWAVEEMEEWLLEGRVLTKIHQRSLKVLKMPNEPNWNEVVNDLRFHAPKESKYSRLSEHEEMSHFLE